MPFPPSPDIGVSIAIPCYNYGHYLRDAIDSGLRQTHRNIEVLVIDDGSTDDSAQIANSYGPPVRCITQNNRGLGAARNRALEEARYDLVVFLDADDRLAPGAVEAFLRGYHSELRPGVVAGCTKDITANGSPLGHKCHPLCFDGIRRIELADTVIMSPFSPIVLADRQFLKSIGGFETDDSTFRGSEDRDLWIRVAASDRALCLVGAVIADYRVHQASMSHNGLRQLASSQAVLARAQQRYGKLLPQSLWRKAWAFSKFQASIMHTSEGRRWPAICELVQSFWLAPWLHHPVMSNSYGQLFRLKRLLVLLIGALRESMISRQRVAL